MKAKFWSVTSAALISAAVFLGITVVGNAAEDYKITTCPPGKPYCIQVIKPALTPEEVANLEAVHIDAAEEARKAQLHAAEYYHYPGATSLCPPPHRMTDLGCR